MFVAQYHSSNWLMGGWHFLFGLLTDVSIDLHRLVAFFLQV